LEPRHLFYDGDDAAGEWLCHVFDEHAAEAHVILQDWQHSQLGRSSLKLWPGYPEEFLGIAPDAAALEAYRSILDADEHDCAYLSGKMAVLDPEGFRRPCSE